MSYNYSALQNEFELREPDSRTAVPTYHQSPPYVAQQQSNTNVVVANQPQSLPAVTVVEPGIRPRPAVLIFSIVLTILCGIHGCLPLFLCLTPGLVFAIVGYSLSDSQSHEQRKAAKAFHGVSLCCNIATLVLYGIYALLFIILLAIYFSEKKSCHSTCTSQSYNGYSQDSCSNVCS